MIYLFAQSTKFIIYALDVFVTSVDNVFDIVMIDVDVSFNCSTSVLMSIKLSWSPC